MSHPLLARQLHKLGLDCGAPPDEQTWRAFLERVDRSYRQSDQDRYTLERSIALSSDEMQLLQRRLAQDRDQLQAIFYSLGEALFVLDSAGRVKMANPRAEQMLQLSSEQIGRLWVGEVFDLAASEQERRRLAKAVQSVLDGGPEYRSDEAEVGVLGGRRFPAAICLTPIRDGERSIGAVLSMRDITARKQLEVELRQAQKLESVGRLAAGVAHEINTPIHFLGDNLRFLTDSVAGLLGLQQAYRAALQRTPPARADQLEIAALERAADLEFLSTELPRALGAMGEGLAQVARIVGALKRFAHPDRAESAPVDLNQAIDCTLQIARIEVDAIAQIERHSGLLAPVTCRISDLNQVVFNLVINAAHAIEERQRSAPGPGLIVVSTRQEGGSAVIEVSDNGTGVPAAIRERIFDPFFTTKPIGKGTGQGLALARSVIDSHGGTIHLIDQPQGCAFLIRLPLAPGARPIEVGGCEAYHA